MKLIYDGQELEAGGLSQEAADGRYLRLSGGRVTGPVEVPAPAAEGQAATKGYVDEVLTGKLDKTATAAAATKLATARTIRTNLASTGAVSFNGTADVTPGVTGVLPVAKGGTGATTAAAACTSIGALPLTGGAIAGNLSLTGNLTLKGSGNYGNKINFGDGDYVHLYEISDDTLEIKATKINFVTGDSTADTMRLNRNNAGLVPKGCIILWSGTANTIPAGWAICDGTNGTPDLRDAVVRGAKSDSIVNSKRNEFYVNTANTSNWVIGFLMYMSLF